jgi:molybdate transport system ATP-binding protein
MAGLQHLHGHVRVGDVHWQESDRSVFLAPHARHLGYVFQEASLFPHLSVRDNLEFGARRVRNPEPGHLAFDDVVKLLGIAHLLDRSTAMLSGGERQRIAVGRALLAQPRLLLMDEPLSALDKQSRDDILPYFELLHERLSMPIIYVSHDFAEVERLADTLVLLDKGRVAAAGTLRTLQLDPRLPLLTCAEAGVVLEGTIAGYDPAYRLTEIAVGGQHIIVPGAHGEVGARRRLRIAASDVSLARSEPAGSTIMNTLPVTVSGIESEPEAPQASVILTLGHAKQAAPQIIARITRKSLDALSIRSGDRVFAQIKSVALTSSRAVKT